MPGSKLLAASVYLGALIVGAALGIAVDRKFVRDPMVERSPEQQRDRFFADIGFSAEQRASWDSITRQGRRADSVLMAPLRAKQDSLTAPLRPQFDSLRTLRNSSWESRNEKLRALLTPEQQKRLDERQRQNDARRQKQTGDRR